MRLVLKSKSAYTDARVTQVWNRIEDHVTEQEAWDAVDAAAAETRFVLDDGAIHPDHAVYGWSGGKDSLALQVVMERAGVRRALLGTIPALEFHAYLNWCQLHAPDHLVEYANRDIDLAWLARPENDKYLFPTKAEHGYKWTLLGTRRAQTLYQQDHHPKIHIYGRRSQDGNVIGREPFGIARSRTTTVYSPLRDWPHELVLAVVHYAGRELPPVYRWPNGWTAGTGSWPGRRVGDRAFSWQQTWDIEPDRVRDAATVIPSARAWMGAHHPQELT